jgi:hypothetical protein
MDFLISFTEKIDLGKDESALPRQWQKHQLEGENMFIAALQIAADESTEEDAFKTHFAAILSVASRLTSEMQETSRRKHTQVYGANVDSAMVQSCCFSYASPSRVLQLIGGLDGNNLSTLTIQQLVHLLDGQRIIGQFLKISIQNYFFTPKNQTLKIYHPCSMEFTKNLMVQ